MKVTKLLSLLLVLTLTLGLLAGCGSSSTSAETESETSEEASTEESTETAEESEQAEEAAQEEETDAQEETAQEETTEATAQENETGDEDMANLSTDEVEEGLITFPLDESVTFTYWIAPESDGSEIMSSYSENYVIQKAEEATNVHIEFTEVSFMAQEEQFNLMVASDSYCDIIQGFGGQYTRGLDNAVEEEIIVDLTSYMEEGYAPYFTAIRDSSDQITKETMTDTGRIASFYFLIGDADEGPRSGLWIRQDWLEALGMEVPETYDEMEEVLLAMKSTYDPSSPLLLTSDGFFSSYTLLGGYDVSGTFYNENGTVKYGPIEDGMKEYLEMMHRWYEEGLISSDFISTTDMSLMFDSTPIISDKCGVWNANYRGDDSWKDSAVDPNFTPLAIKDMTKTGTEQIHVGGKTSNVNNYGVVISTDCEDVETAIAWCDWWYSDEATLLSSYGVEGETFNYNEDGQPIYTDLILNNEQGTVRSMRNVYTGMSLAFRVYRVVTTGVDNGYDIIDRGTWDSNRDNAWDISTYISRTTEEGEEYSSIMADIETYVEQQILSFITGESDLADWDSYVARVEEMGIEDAIAIQQAAVDRFESR